MIRKSREWDSATTMMRQEGSGIERQVTGRIGGLGDVDALNLEYAQFQADVEFINLRRQPDEFIFGKRTECGSGQQKGRPTRRRSRWPHDITKEKRSMRS